LEIRESDERDLKDIEELERESFSDPWSEKSLRPSFGTKILVGEVARDAEYTKDPGSKRIVGYAIIRTVADEAELLRICVAKDTRRNGYGRKILSSALELAKNDGAEKMFLEVRSANAPARGLYTSAGFEETGIRKNYYSDPVDDAVIMVKLQ